MISNYVNKVVGPIILRNINWPILCYLIKTVPHVIKIHIYKIFIIFHTYLRGITRNIFNYLVLTPSRANLSRVTKHRKHSKFRCLNPHPAKQNHCDHTSVQKLYILYKNHQYPKGKILQICHHFVLNWFDKCGDFAIMKRFRHYEMVKGKA